MAGIVTTSTQKASINLYRAAFTSTSTSLAINWVSGTTSAAAGPRDTQDLGIYVTFQNQSSAANATIGDASLTVNARGIILGPLTTSAATQQSNTYTVFSAMSPSAIQMQDWYVTTTSSVGVVTAQLVHAV